MMRIQEGQPAPLFSATAIRGDMVRLDGFMGRHVLLSFQRYAGCPLCNLRTYYLTMRYPAFKGRGLDILVVIESPADAILRQETLRDAPFPIIADPQQHLYQLYGVKTSVWGALLGRWRMRATYADGRRQGMGDHSVPGDRTRIPADFLIGPDLMVQRAYYGRDLGDNLPIEEVEAFSLAYAGR
jgi:thioredoxin-dependent peroxiredoxin